MVKANVLHYNLLLLKYMILGATAVMDKSTDPRPLIYDRDEIHSITYYCEFATMDQLKPGAYSRTCQQRNPTTKMIHEGETYYPWLKFSSGKNGILLECPTLPDKPDLTCSEGFKVYSICDFSCPDGFVKTNSTVTCEATGPIQNISATWSSNLNTLCKKFPSGKAIEGNSSQSDNDLFYLFFLTLPVIAVIGVVIHLRWKKTTCKRRQPQGLPELPFQNIGNMHPDSNRSVNRLHGGSEEDGSQKKLLISQKLSLEEIVKDVSDSDGNLSSDCDDLCTPLQSELGSEDPAFCREDVKQTRLSPEQAMAPSPKQSVKKLNCCNARLTKLKDQTLDVHKQLAGVLEYWSEKTLTSTLYGYVLENWTIYGFQNEQEVKLYQHQEQHRGGLTAIEFFLQRLYENGASTHDLLLYFHRHEAKESLHILLKFHECLYCRGMFEYEALRGND